MKIIIAIILVIAIGAGIYVALDNRERSPASETSNTPNGTGTTTDATGGNNAAGGGIMLRAAAMVQTYLAQSIKIDPSEVTILEAEPREWPDGCLGLGGSDELCTQVITPGHRIKAEARGRIFTYRTNEDGTNIRAE